METKEKAIVRGRHILLFLVLCPVIVLLVAYLVPLQKAQNGLMLPLAVFFGLGLIGILVAAAPLGTGMFPALGFQPVQRKFYVIGIAGTIALSLAVSLSGIEPEGMKQALKVGRAPPDIIFALAVMAVLAPLVEELLFRGLLYGWIENRWSPMAALVVTSLLFALAHYEPKHIVLVAPLGFYFGWLRWRTGSIKPALAAHMANNGFAVLAAVVLGGG